MEGLQWQTVILLFDLKLVCCRVQNCLKKLYLVSVPFVKCLYDCVKWNVLAVRIVPEIYHNEESCHEATEPRSRLCNLLSKGAGILLDPNTEYTAQCSPLTSFVNMLNSSLALQPSVLRLVWWIIPLLPPEIIHPPFLPSSHHEFQYYVKLSTAHRASKLLVSNKLH